MGVLDAGVPMFSGPVRFRSVSWKRGGGSSPLIRTIRSTFEPPRPAMAVEVSFVRVPARGLPEASLGVQASVPGVVGTGAPAQAQRSAASLPDEYEACERLGDLDCLADAARQVA